MPKTTLLRKQVTPTGTIQPHAGGTAPDGFLVCDGTIVNIADYPKLFAIIGTSWGYGNNDGLTFHLPDLRGRFLRGVDNPSGIPGEEAGRDPDSGARTPSNMGGNSGDAVGSVQDSAFANHGHATAASNINIGYGGWRVISGYNTNLGSYGVSDAVGGATSGYGNETRPINANVTYVIKVV